MFFDRLTEFDISLLTAEEIYIMALGYFIVFLVLSLMYFVFQNMPRVLKLGSKARSYLDSSRKTLMEAAENTVSKNGSKKDEKTTPEPAISGEVNAAIGAAIHLFANEQHDEEDTVLTIEEVSRRYSPWSSKIYSVTNLRR